MMVQKVYWPGISACIFIYCCTAATLAWGLLLTVWKAYLQLAAYAAQKLPWLGHLGCIDVSKASLRVMKYIPAA